MKNLLLITALLLAGIHLSGQNRTEPLEGTISFLSTQNVYVKFSSTKGINSGDTLYLLQNNQPIPILVVKELSSTSCVCLPITAMKLNVSDRIYFYQSQKVNEEGKKEENIIPAVVLTPPVTATISDSGVSRKPLNNKPIQSIHGHLSLGSFSNFSNTSAPSTQRMQYVLSLNARNLGSSGLSIESYMVFQQRLDSTWKAEFKESVFNGLKIYSLAINYDFNKMFSLAVGRKINPKLSNMGAVDGLQFETRLKPITIGIIAGARPDFYTYGFNFNLLQFGAYIYNEVATKNGPIQSTLAIVQQSNSGQTDRRFLYLQHSNSYVKNLNFFGTAELDLYNPNLVLPDTTKNETDTTLQNNNGIRLTNLYLSLRYRLNRKLSFSLSYSNRQNIVYYSMYEKSYLEKLLEFETTQGYLFQINYRPINRLFIGVTTGYRFQKKDPKPTSNLNAYITYSDIPKIGISMTGSALLLQTSYLTGGVYGIGISKDFAKGKLYSSLSYKYINYKFSYSNEKLPQNVFEFDLTWRIYKKISLSAYYEGTYESVNQLNRIYGQLNIGF